MNIAILAALLLLRSNPGQGCSIPFDIAPVHIDSHGPFRFLIDTGTSTTVISSELAKRLGIAGAGAVRALGSTGAVEVQRAVLEELRVGPLSRSAFPVLIADLPRFRSHGRLDGILGMDVWSGHSLFLDVQRRCVTVDAEVTGGSVVETESIAGLVALKADSMNLILDSGASFTVLLSERAMHTAMRGDTMEVTSVGGRRLGASATIPKLRIGDLVLRDVPAALMRGTDPRDDALLPVALFTSVYLDAGRSYAVMNGSAH